MSEPELRLVLPCRELHASFLEMADEFHAAGETDWPHGGRPPDDLAVRDIDAYLRQEEAMRSGRNLPEDRVPCTTWWLTADGEVVGTLSFRHELNEFLRRFGGTSDTASARRGAGEGG